MFFSVVMPSYKTDSFMVQRAIDSVMLQTFSDFEIIIVDDNDENDYKNNNRKLQKEYSNDNIKFVFHPKNKGANFARNTGVSLSNGEYVAFIDSDDQWNKDYLRVLHKTIEQSHKNLYTTNFQIVRADGILPPVFTNKQKSGYIFEKEIYEDLLGPTSTVCVKRKTIIDAGLFDTSLPARQDYDMWLRICKHHECFFIHKPLVYIYWDGHESISSSCQRYTVGTEIVLKKILSDKNVSPSLYDSIKFAHYKSIAHASIHVNDYNNARKYLSKALKKNKNVECIIWYILCLTPSTFKFLKQLRTKMLIKKKS